MSSSERGAGIKKWKEETQKEQRIKLSIAMLRGIQVFNLSCFLHWTSVTVDKEEIRFNYLARVNNDQKNLNNRVHRFLLDMCSKKKGGENSLEGFLLWFVPTFSKGYQADRNHK